MIVHNFPADADQTTVQTVQYGKQEQFDYRKAKKTLA